VGAIAENFNGAKWLSANTAKVSSPSADLNSVACTTNWCVAAGSMGTVNTQALVETTN
jgi:hypothetical protein